MRLPAETYLTVEEPGPRSAEPLEQTAHGTFRSTSGPHSESQSACNDKSVGTRKPCSQLVPTRNRTAPLVTLASIISLTAPVSALSSPPGEASLRCLVAGPFDSPSAARLVLIATTERQRDHELVALECCFSGELDLWGWSRFECCPRRRAPVVCRAANATGESIRSQTAICCVCFNVATAPTCRRAKTTSYSMAAKTTYYSEAAKTTHYSETTLWFHNVQSCMCRDKNWVGGFNMT